MFLRSLTFLGSLAILTILIPASITVGQDCETCKDKAPKAQSKSSSKSRSKRAPRSSFSSALVRRGKDIEKAMKVHKNVVMSFCVIGAPIRVNGWNRSEIRTFVSRAQPFSYKIRGVNEKDDKATWVEIKSDQIRSEGCLRGRSIEIDAPIGSTLKISGRSGNTSIKVDSVDSVKITLRTGDIALSNVSRSVYARTNLGGITVRNSKGDIDLNTTAGNIVAYDTKPAKIGDPLRARSVSGTVLLSAIQQKEVKASSISGTLSYRGILYKYGNYDFRTTSGLISLVIPSTSSFRLKANYGGAFVSHFDLKNLQKRSFRDAVSLTANVGEGKDCSVFTNSYSGSITIARSDQPKKRTVLVP